MTSCSIDPQIFAISSTGHEPRKSVETAKRAYIIFLGHEPKIRLNAKKAVIISFGHEPKIGAELPKNASIISLGLSEIAAGRMAPSNPFVLAAATIT